MKKEKKELLKKFKVVIEDLLDNYESYTDEEKEKIKDVFQKVADLNKLLDKYDVDSRDEDRHSFWEEYVTAYGQFFDMFRY
jgi:uncharacterized protein with von Willebrand factor type A (vWA) domain